MLAIRLFGRFRAYSPGLIAKASTSTSRCYRVPCLIAYAGGSTMLVRSCSQFLRVRHAMCNLEKEEHDPWILLPRRKDAAKSTHPLLKRVVLLPVTVVVAVYEALRMALRFLVLSFRFLPLLITYPVCSRFEKTYDLWWRLTLWHVQASGPTLIKLGQWASTRRDVFSKEFCDRLAILHTKTKKRRLFRNHDKVLRNLFGSEVLKHKEKIFPAIEPYSIGSGCIAHVYRLTMDMNEYEKVAGVRVPGLEGAGRVEMAVKVSERGVEEMIEMDLSIVNKLARWTQIFMPSLKYLDPIGAIEQFEMVLRRQVDLRSEARALHKFQENFDPVKTGIRFPIVVAYNKKSIIETYEHGMYINRLVAEESNPDLKSKQSHAVRRKIALLGARALLKMVFVDNFVHGDLHPGNILIRFNDKEASGVHFAPPSDSLFQKAKDFFRSTFRIRGSPKLTFSDSPDLNDEPTLVLLDTGIAISETPKNLRNLRRIFRCIVEKRGYRAGELILEESPDQQCNDKELFCREVEQLVTKARSERSLRTLNISALMSQLFNIVAEHRVQLDSAFTSILLSIMVLEGVSPQKEPIKKSRLLDSNREQVDEGTKIDACDLENALSMATVELAPGVQTFETPKSKILKEDHKIDVNEISTHAKHVTPLLKPSSSTKHSSLVQGSIPKETAIATHAAIYGLTPEKEKRLRELYDRLDMDNDGTIDIRDLTMALKHEMPHIPSRMAPLLMQKMAADSSNSSVDFGDFAKYVIDHEERLEKVFADLDQNKDGYIDVQEIQIYCDTQGVPISDKRAADIVQQMGQTDNINLQEFQDYMLLYPSSDPKEIAQFWRHNLIFDIGEDSQLPEDFTQEEIQSGVWWRHLVAGAVAGCMSRTSTAPLDRIKVYLQVHASRQNPLNLFSAVRLLYAEGGIRSFWRGNGINVVKIAPESAIKFMAYEQFKRWIQEYKGSNELTIYERLFAGSCAGVMSQTTIYPMEVLKTRLALRRTGQLDRGLIYFAHKLYRREGIIVFYKGYIPNLLGIIPYAGIDLAIYETMKNLYLKRNPEKKEPGTLALLACGTISSTCGQLASYPLALVRTRLQAREWIADPNQPDTMLGQFRYIIRSEGFTGLYRGLVPNFMKVIPAVGISYVVYENVRRHLGAKMS